MPPQFTINRLRKTK